MKYIPPIEINDTRLIASNVPPTPQSEAATYDPSGTYNKGARVQIDQTRSIYEAFADGITGKYPPDNLVSTEENVPAPWQRVMTTNPGAMFDGRIGTYTRSSEPFLVGEGSGIQFEILPGYVVNTLVLFGLSGVAVRAEMIDPREGIVYDKIKSLTSNAGITNMYRYLFNPIERKTDVTFLDMPNYGTAKVRISIYGSSNSPAKCGLFVLGKAFNIGYVEWGLSAGIRDFSRVEENDFGITDITKRGYVRRASFDVEIKRNETNGVYRFLAKYRATPGVWIGYEGNEPTIIYGVFIDFDIIYPHAAWNKCAIDVRGVEL